MKTAKIALTTVLVITALAVIYLALSGKVTDIYSETYKTAIQLLVVAVTGHVVTFLVTKLNHEREEIRAKDEFRRKIIEKLNSAYIEIKRHRRLTRAKNTPVSGGYPISIQVESYNSLMEEVNDIQLQIEILAKEIEAFQGIFKAYREVQDYVDKMEDYLNKMINEYEHVAPVATGNPAIYSLDVLPEVSDLLGEYKGSKFRTRFVKPYYLALDLIRCDLIYAGENYSSKRPRKKPHNKSSNSDAASSAGS